MSTSLTQSLIGDVRRRSLLKATGAALAGLGVAGTVGCSSGNDPGADGPNAPDPADRVELPDPRPEVKFPEPYVGPKAYDRKPFGDGSQTFTVVVPQDATWVGDWNDNTFTTWMEQRTGIKVDFQAVSLVNPDGSRNLAKINAMLTSGELPDAFMSVGLSPSQISLYGQQGLFADLTGLIDTYAPVARQMLEEVTGLRQTISALDGKIYQFASVNECYHCRTGVNKTFINQVYLDKIGAKVPETTDEFRSVLQELKETNPSGNANFMTFAGGVGNVLDAWFVNPFTYNPGSPWLRMNGDKVEFVANTDGWRDGMRYMRQLYDDGTLTKQSLTITREELTKLGNQGLVGCVRSLYWGGFVTIDYAEGARWRDYVGVPPIAGPSGQRIAATNHYTSPFQTMVITSACKNPELLVQWADYQMDLDGILNGFPKGGVQGEQWDWSKEGAKGIDGRQAVWNAFNNTQESGVTLGWNQYSQMYRSLDERNGQEVSADAPTFESDLYTLSKAYEEYAQPLEQQLPPLLFDDAATATLSDLRTTIANHVNQSTAAFATAGQDINDDAVWNAYVDTLQKMNLDQYLELYQQAYEKRPK